MDWRIVVVLSPLIIAAVWALINIGAAALRQVNEVLSREN
jgi:photosystem II PsbY protein